MKPSPDSRQVRVAQIAFVVIVIAFMIGSFMFVFAPRHIHATTTTNGVGTTTMDCEGTYDNTHCTFNTSP